MTSTRWPLVVSYLLTTVPALPGWSTVAVFDADPVTASVPASYAVVARTSDDTTSGTYTRVVAPSGLIAESGLVRVHVVTRTGNVDPAQVRDDGFALAASLEAALLADRTLGGVLGEAGTVSVAVDVQSVASAGGVAQSLVVSVSYTALT
jgi:hypothetical protein